MKILVTGSAGQLGIDLINILSGEHDVIGVTRKELDITDKKRVLEYFTSSSFDTVINAAAYTHVDKCETDFYHGFLVNALGPRNLAVASYENGFKLIHISTDYVFDGNKSEGYYEYDPPKPINKYGMTKLCGENYIKTHCHNYFIVRTAWLYGKYGNNFVKSMLSQSEKQQEIYVVNDQTGSPTLTNDLVNFISTLMVTDKYGFYHFTNSESCTWYDFAKEIFKIIQKDIKVLPISTEEFNALAKRPRYSILNNHKAKLEFNWEARKWYEALRQYLLDINY